MSVRVRFLGRIAELGEAAWSTLAPNDHPFLSYAFLHALERSDSLKPEHGWQPYHAAAYRNEQLVAAMPCYIKTNSHGEFVYDWAWADAYHRHNLAYYPKLVTAIPYSPVNGSRTLVCAGITDPGALRAALWDAVLAEVDRNDWSSWHCNFLPEEEQYALRQARAELLARHDYQFHWHNRQYTDFAHFLAQLNHKKRKNIRQERQRIRRQGIRTHRKPGDALNAEELRFAYRCYRDTFLRHGNYPNLSYRFFELLQRDLGRHTLFSIATYDGRPLACAIFLIGGNTLYGRYWGCTETVPGLHFELAYYQGIEYCIEQGLQRFEPGAQGEHKIPRGFEPTRTYSVHYVRHPAFRAAISHYLNDESEWLEAYHRKLQMHRPFRQVVELDKP